jgi:cysteine desulfuration protein SufE
MSSLWPQHIDDIVEEFKDCFDSMERYELLFEYAKKNPNPLLEEDWTEENQILGCQSRAHVICSLDEKGSFILKSGADAQIVQGLMSITSIAVNGLNPTEVSNLTPAYIEEMGLKAALSPNRANGFLNMFNRVIKEAKILSET